MAEYTEVESGKFSDRIELAKALAHAKCASLVLAALGFVALIADGVARANRSAQAARATGQ